MPITYSPNDHKVTPFSYMYFTLNQTPIYEEFKYLIFIIHFHNSYSSGLEPHA